MTKKEIKTQLSSISKNAIRVEAEFGLLVDRRKLASWCCRRELETILSLLVDEAA